MAEMEPFEEMKGGKVLTFVHTILLETAAKRRSLLKASADITQVPISSTERQEVRALEAAADMILIEIGTAHV